MAFYGQYTGFGGGAAAGPQTFLSMITKAGLTTDLELCLDAADSASYTSGQDWVDVSGSSNADEFFRGESTGADSEDPTFNGVVGGLSSAEYWSFDGGDEFEYGAANETWMKNMHKNNADFSLMMAWYHPSGHSGGSGTMGTEAGHGTNGTGVSLTIQAADDTVKYQVAPAGDSTTWVFHNISDTGLNENAWNIIGLSIDEATGSGGGFHYLNGAYNQVSSADTFDATYYSDATIVTRQGNAVQGAGDASWRLHIGGGGRNDPGSAAGTRMGVAAFWSTALSKANMDAIYAKLAVRYGL
jgi:hypothetical protein